VDPLDRFREIVVVDSEFVAAPSERPVPVCVCAKLLRSGQEIMVWRDEMGATPPYPIGDDVLFVAFAAAAELEVHLALGWPLPAHVLDLRVEHINQTGISERNEGQVRAKPPRALLAVLRHYGIKDGDAAIKDAMRSLIMTGAWPAIEAKRGEILRYCLNDAAALGPLLWKLLPGIRNFDQALRRGEYVALTAEVCHNGIPFDSWAMGRLQQREIRQALRLRLVSNESLAFGLYDGATLKQARLKEFAVRHKLPWKRTPTGRLSTSRETFEYIARDHPEFAGLAEIQKTLSMLHEFELAAGADDRCRTPIWAFSTITGRMAPNGSAYPFTTAAWTRNLITPAPGTALAYLDFASMEFGVAAGLSRCEPMIRDYREGDPYLGFGIEAGLAPLGATTQTHATFRERLKPMLLAIQYGGGDALVAGRLGIDQRAGARLVELHHQKYPGYWDWSDRQLYVAFADGVLITRDGWQCRVSSRTSEFTARNWLIQALSAGIFRYAGLMARRLRIKICAVVHDALLIEVPADRIEEEVARATLCLERASRMFLHDLVLRVDAKIIREGERFTDKRGGKLWDYVERTLQELDQVDLRHVA
jgi:DNA polymerase-1